MLFPSGNPFKCHEEVFYLQPLIPPKRFDIFSSLTGECSKGLGAFCFFFNILSVNGAFQLNSVEVLIGPNVVIV